MNIFERRKYKKHVKHMLHESKHAYNMRLDVADSEDLKNLKEAQQTVREAWKTKDKTPVENALESLSEAISKVYPAPTSPRVRETVEIIAVALIVAWALRTYFIQPFKIPTGSMQPTLYGITTKPPLGDDQKFMKFLPVRLARLVLFGERDVTVKAKVSGTVVGIGQHKDGSRAEIVIAAEDESRRQIRHRIPSRHLPLNVGVGAFVTKGTILTEGRVLSGDHIFVDKVRYNFFRPKLGDIFVFSTVDLDYPGIKTNQYYIKRLAGMPGDRV
ncbi:MAG: S26 family signal peptidase, partial [Verrucomicrobiota bacterium]